MAAAMGLVGPPAAFTTLRLVARTSPSTLHRALSNLPNNPHVYAHPQPSTGPTKSYILSYLPTSPVIPSLAIGTTTTLPPTPDSLTENPDFLALLHETLKEQATSDPEVQAQAALYASQAGSALGSGGVFFPQHQQRQRKRRDRAAAQQTGGGGGAGGDGSGAASSQGGMGGASRPGYVHVSDQRSPPDFGRVAWPEDIFGSLEVDGLGGFVEEKGRYQKSGTYRMVTREGMLGLSEYLRKRLVERLKELDERARRNS